MISEKKSIASENLTIEFYCRRTDKNRWLWFGYGLVFNQKLA
jgi:hypothetical protein